MTDAVSRNACVLSARRVLCWLWLVVFFRSTHARLRFVDPVSGRVIPGSKSWETQRFVYYNSRNPATVSGPGIGAAGLTYMDGKECKLAEKGSPAFEALKGKIVFGGIWEGHHGDRECLPIFDQFFDMLREAEAKAYVGNFQNYPPGVECFKNCECFRISHWVPLSNYKSVCTTNP